MDLPKVVIKQNFQDYLAGKEVEASVVSHPQKEVWPGERVMAFKDSLAATSNMPVPTSELSHSIGIEGTVTQVMHLKTPASDNIERPVVKIIKA
jgi:hypothetical protein